MLNELVGALKPILATMLVGGAAVVVVAPAFDMAAHQVPTSRAAHGPEATPEPSEDDPDADEMRRPSFEVLFRECLESRDADSDQCAAAALESGMSYDDFRAKIVSKLEPAPTEQPQPTAKSESRSTTKKTEPVVKKPEPTKNTDDDFWTWFDKCLDSRDVFSDACARAQELIGFDDADFHAKFDRYLAERDGTPAKTTPKPTTKSFLTTAMLEECGKTHVTTSDACIRALALSGMRA